MAKFDIRYIAYMLYKEDWSTIVSIEEKLNSIRKYAKEVQLKTYDMDAYPYENYLLDNGYDTGYYPSYDDFISMEYIDDRTYICHLLKDEALIDAYLQDIRENFGGSKWIVIRSNFQSVIAGVSQFDTYDEAFEFMVDDFVISYKRYNDVPAKVKVGFANGLTKIDRMRAVCQESSEVWNIVEVKLED